MALTGKFLLGFLAFGFVLGIVFFAILGIRDSTTLYIAVAAFVFITVFVVSLWKEAKKSKRPDKGQIPDA